MSIATAENAIAQGTWVSSMFQGTVDDIDHDSAEAVITVNGNDERVMAEVTSILRDHHANVRSGYGCRLTRVIGSQFYVEVPRDQVEQIDREIERRFASKPRPMAHVEDFRVVNRWVANREIVIYIRKDRPGVLAAAFEAMERCRVNVVTMAAATGPSIDPEPGPHPGESYWGRASIKVHVEDAAAFWEELVNVARKGGWDQVHFTPVKGGGGSYSWAKDSDEQV